MFDSHNRAIRYLRISVTDLCNLRCVYCMPAEGVAEAKPSEVLSFEEIYEFTKVAVGMGVEKVKITGGEPLVRKNITELLAMLSSISGIKDFGLTTNGVLLKQYAGELRKAGVQRLNISLDTVHPERYREITRIGVLQETLLGIETVLQLGFEKIKLNCVIKESPDEDDARGVADFAQKKGLEVRFIRQMDTEKGEFWPVIGGDGGNCAVCNRIRLSSKGMIFPCLFSDLSYDIRRMGYREAMLAAVQCKPEKGKHSHNRFCDIGG